MPDESPVRAWGAALGAHSAWRLAVTFLLLPATFYYVLNFQTLDSAYQSLTLACLRNLRRSTRHYCGKNMSAPSR